MSRKRKKNEIDADKVRQQAMDFGSLVGAQAKEAGDKAADLAGQGKAWASDVAVPTLDKAWRDGVKVAAPKVEAVAEKARPAVDQARDKLVDDYIPRLQKAMHDAAEAAESGGTVTEKATKAGAAAKKAVTTKPRKRRRGAKTVGWVLVGTVAAGTGYLLWRRSQPIDDPWAEEYWDDAALTTPSSPAARDAAAATATAADKAAGAVKDAAGAAAHGARSAADNVKAGAQKAGDKIAGAADKAADAAEKTGDAAAKKADTGADKAGDAADKAADAATTATDKKN